jgi:hypothetical protein
MPDITMCMSAACKFRKYCYRYTATPSEYRQSFAKFEPESDGCDYYIEDSRRTGEKAKDKQG